MDNPGLLPTPYASVNGALAQLLSRVRAVLGMDFTGMYLVGSLALGDFDPAGSDIDLIVVAEQACDDAQVAALRAVHRDFAASGSLWARKVETVYVPRAALSVPPTGARYPQVETELGFVLEPLEAGWLAQCYTLAAHGVTVAGPEPDTFVPPVDGDAMRCTLARIPAMWRDDARYDPSWLAWLRVRRNQAFVALTLCRLLYTLATGVVGSKPVAARWAMAALGDPWAGLIARTLAERQRESVTPEHDVVATVALVEYTVAQFQLREE